MSARAPLLVAAALACAGMAALAHADPPADKPDAPDAPDAPLDAERDALADAPPTFDAHATQPVGFDHRIHDRNLIVAGREALACTRCHVLARGEVVGRPGHDACFGACHGAAPRATTRLAVAGDQVRVCTACHAGAALAVRAGGKPGKLTVPYPPYTIDRDFGLTLSHQQHARAACTACHFTGATAMTAPHARCTPCHAAALEKDGAPPMNACAACHPDAYGPASGPHLVAHALALDGFDHGRHRARAPAAACTACHATIASADGATLDPPTTASCAAAGCHDGTAAFATTAACTRCHARAPTQTFRPPRPVARYSHAAHAPRLGDVACGTCHGLDAHGEATAPGHAACVRCHADDYASAAPAICGACHVGTEPWRPMIADRGPSPETELGARLSHAAHASVGDCTRCHTTRTSERELRPPRGHAACASCHRASSGPAPHLDDCAACHVLGAAAARTRERLAAPWSVRARFRHAPHATAACTSCHAGVAAATTIEAVPTPPKAACAPCHDGATAFKLTGTGCARCHDRTSP